MKDRESTKPDQNFPNTSETTEGELSSQPTAEQKRQWLKELEQDLANVETRGSAFLANVKKRRKEALTSRLEKMTAEELEGILINLEGARRQALIILGRRDLPAESRVFHEESLEIFEKNIQQVKAALEKIKGK